MSARKATLFLVPGAWHRFESFVPFTDRLRAAGYVVEGASLPSTAGDGAVGMLDDAAMIAREITRLSDSGQTVIPIFHSYAGIPGAEALSGLSRDERRAKGHPGGVVGIIWVTAFVPTKGQSMMGIVGGTFPDYMTRDIQKGTITITADPIPILYNTSPTSDAAALAAALVSQSEQSFLDPCTREGYADSVYDGRRAYIQCEQDNALPISAQEGMVAASGVPWIAKRVNTDNTPFVSDPDILIRELGAAIDEFAPFET